MPTAIPRELVDAYRSTDYRITTDAGVFSFRVDSVCSRLLDLQTLHAVGSSALITAWNPYSEPTSDAENAAALAELENALTARGLTFLPAVGVDPLGFWPGEPSVLILGIGKPDAVDLGNQFRQNAIIWAGREARPQLILLR